MTLSRPDHNLLNEPMLRELADGISFVAEREDIKLIVLDSAGKVSAVTLNYPREYVKQQLGYAAMYGLQ